MQRLLCALILPLLLSACRAVEPPADSLAAAAREYVRLQLAIGEKEEGYIDAYYGPEELRAEGKAIAAGGGRPRLRARGGQGPRERRLPRQRACRSLRRGWLPCPAGSPGCKPLNRAAPASSWRS